MSELIECLDGLRAEDIVRRVTKSGFYIQTKISFCSEYQAIHDSFIVKPDSGIANQQNKLVSSLISAGVWTKLDVLYIFANNTSANALINWITPGFCNSTLAGALDPAFVALEGFTGAGTGYINTNYSFSVDSTNYKQNDASVLFYRREDAFGNADLAAGARNSVSTFRTSFILDQTDGVGNIYINKTSKSTAVEATNNGLFSASLLNGTLTTYKNGGFSSVSTGLTPIALEDLDCFILCYNLNGAPNSYYLSDCAVYGMGGALTLGQHIKMSEAIETYMDYNGKGVIPQSKYHAECDGNSLTQGYLAATPYPTTLATLDADYTVFNRGQGGDTSADMEARSETVDRAYKTTYIENICVAWEITNDIFVDGKTAQQAVDAFGIYCAGRKALGYTVIVLSTIPRGLDAGLNATLTAANALLTSQYRGFADYYLDLRTNSKLTNVNDATYFQVDRTHLTTAGNNEVAAMVHAKIQSIL